MLSFKRLILPLLWILILVSGCGKKDEISEFQDNMTTFYTEITAIGTTLNGITPDSEDAVTHLLTALDSMEAQFNFLAQIQVPEEFISVESLADDASMHMSEAVSLYHQAYAEGTYDENLINAAIQHYQSAMKRVNYIATLLQGEIPEGDDVIITEGDDTELTPYSGE